MPDGKMMKDSAHDDKKKNAPMMQKVAARAVKSHEKRMHSNEKRILALLKAMAWLVVVKSVR